MNALQLLVLSSTYIEDIATNRTIGFARLRWLATSKVLLALLCLGSSANGQSPLPSAVHQVPTRMTQQADFRIPFQVSHNARVQEVQLFVSTDEGRTWNLYQRQNAQATGFAFHAIQDGIYSFAVRTIDGRLAAASNQRFQPELRVIVDTKNPQLDVRANVDRGGKLTAEWQIQDPYLAAHTFRISTQEASGAWRSVFVRTPDQQDTRQHWSGRTSWAVPPSTSEVVIKVEVMDRAGNATVVHKRISTAPAPTARSTQQVSAKSNSSSAVSEFRDTIRSQLPDWLLNRENTLEAASNRPEPDQKWTQWPRGQQEAPVESFVRNPVGQRRTSSFPPEIRPRISSSPNLELDYEFSAGEAIDFRQIELWYTRDRGATWELYGADPDGKSPMEVQLRHEGLYGFLLTAQTLAGSPTEPPEDGTTPDMLVLVDWSKPTGHITSATLNRDHEMLIEWTADDTHLTDTPIGLSYAADPTNGPWIPIASDLRNKGMHRWRMDRQLPRQTYLRLEIRDQAGNTTLSVYDPAITSGGDPTPSIRIRDVRPMRRTALRPIPIR